MRDLEQARPNDERQIEQQRQFAPRVRFVKEPRSCLGRGPASRSDDETLPEPARSFCLGFGLAEGQVIIT